MIIVARREAWEREVKGSSVYSALSSHGIHPIRSGFYLASLFLDNIYILYLTLFFLSPFFIPSNTSKHLD